MCGIIGVLSSGRPAPPLILDALKRLEYRGYDSAGLATLDEGGVMRRLRATGKLAALKAAHDAAPLAGSIGMGHTRWATHGAPTKENAHPHVAGPVAVVHNGIIENYRDLKADLLEQGANFASDTDTEVAAQLCAGAVARGLSPVDAAAETIGRLRGAFAIVFLFEGANDLLVAARNGPPLAIGWGEGEMFVASDALALAALTDDVTHLEDGDWTAVTRAGAHVFDAKGLPVERPRRRMALEAGAVGKDGHRHFMAKEIHEQPAVARRCLTAWEADGGAPSPAFADLDWTALERVTLVGCGTAYYACLAARWQLETIARLHADADVASEFRYRAPPMPERGLAIFVSQSGETADTLAAMRYAKAQGQTTAALVNVDSSTMAREADIVAPLLAGPEIGVASTKAFLAQLLALSGVALAAARGRGMDVSAPLRALRNLPDALATALRLEPEAAAIARALAPARDVLYLGRGPMQVLAMEGALKLKELAYIHAEGYPAGELKHGPIALIDERTPVVALAPQDALFEKTVSNLHEVAARGGPVTLVTDAAGAAAVSAEPWRLLTMPTVDPFIVPIVYAAPMQLLAYHAALARGADIDQPRNLAKSVTVE
jgi:glucosamine--fructose-6-phosphate aminotransferase (isomerizing)